MKTYLYIYMYTWVYVCVCNDITMATMFAVLLKLEFAMPMRNWVFRMSISVTFFRVIKHGNWNCPNCIWENHPYIQPCFGWHQGHQVPATAGDQFQTWGCDHGRKQTMGFYGLSRFSSKIQSPQPTEMANVFWLKLGISLYYKWRVNQLDRSKIILGFDLRKNIQETGFTIKTRWFNDEKWWWGDVRGVVLPSKHGD